MKKYNKSQENIYLLMKERLGKYMNEGVEQDLREFQNFVSEQKQERENHLSRNEISPAYFYSINLS